jgi:delta1-piperideine-2-carboxylate reductase
LRVRDFMSTSAATVSLTLGEIGDLAECALARNGYDEENTGALVRTVVAAERDGSLSHGLFRIPGYVASLRSGKVNGAARPKVTLRTPAIISVHADDGFAPARHRAGPACPRRGGEEDRRRGDVNDACIPLRGALARRYRNRMS